MRLGRSGERPPAGPFARLGSKPGADVAPGGARCRRRLPRLFAGFSGLRPQRRAAIAPGQLRDYCQLRFWISLSVHKLERVDLAGHSFGGRVCLMLGADHPQRVGKMLLFNAAGLRPRQSFPARARLKAYRFVAVNTGARRAVGRRRSPGPLVPTAFCVTRLSRRRWE